MKKLLFALISLSVIFVCRGQRFGVEAVQTAAMDMSAARHVRPDLNGQPCALVKFEIASPNAKFQGNVVGDVHYDVGEYWVYASPGTKELHVLHESLLPLKLYFPDYGIPALESKVTYVVTLRLPSTQSVQPSADNRTRYVYPFRDEVTGYYGLKNDLGEEVIEPRYEEMVYNKDSGNFIVVMNEKIGLINSMGREMLPCVYDKPVYEFVTTLDFVVAAKDGSWGIVDYNNQVLVPFDYDYIEPMKAYDNKLLCFQNKGNKWALVSADGFKPLTTFKYELMCGPSSLYSNPVVSLENTKCSNLIGVVENGKWGFIDDKGEMKIPARYDHYDGHGTGDCPIFYNGYAIVEYGENYGIIDETGKDILSNYAHTFTQLNDYPNVFIFAYNPDKEGYEVYDENIRKITDKTYSRFEVCGDSMAIFSNNNGMQGILDLKTGKDVPGFYDEVYFYGLGQDRIMIKKGDKWGCIDRSGKQIFDYKYDETYGYSNGAARVKLGGKWGFVKLDGRELIAPKYVDVTYFAEDRLAGVCSSEGGWALMNILGKTVTPHKYWIFDWTPTDCNGFFYRKVQSNKDTSKWGYINYRGQEIVPCEHSEEDAARLLDVYLRQNGHITE